MDEINSDEQIELFLKAIEEGFSGLNPKTFWPLNGGQIDSYFDVYEALDIYYNLKKLRENKSVEEIANLMPNADIIRIFLQHNSIIGLKVANKLGIANISEKEKVNYLLFLFDILKHKVNSDVFCLDGKNHLFYEKEVENLLKETQWNNIESNEDKKKIAFLTVMANNLCYTLYYDIFMTGGFYIHGPYDVSNKFGENTILLVREYHNLNPRELWPDLEMPYKKLVIMAVYKDLNVSLNFVNHLITKDTIGNKLISYKIFLDDREIDFKDIDNLIDLFHKISSSQTKKINSLSDLDKVRKGAEISFYLFKDFREKLGLDWKPSKEVEEVISKFGNKFIQQFKYEKIPDLEHWKKLFDPRNDYY